MKQTVKVDWKSIVKSIVQNGLDITLSQAGRDIIEVGFVDFQIRIKSAFSGGKKNA